MPKEHLTILARGINQNLLVFKKSDEILICNFIGILKIEGFQIYEKQSTI